MSCKIALTSKLFSFPHGPGGFLLLIYIIPDLRWNALRLSMVYDCLLLPKCIVSSLSCETVCMWNFFLLRLDQDYLGEALLHLNRTFQACKGLKNSFNSFFFFTQGWMDLFQQNEIFFFTNGGRENKGEETFTLAYKNVEVKKNKNNNN